MKLFTKIVVVCMTLLLLCTSVFAYSEGVLNYLEAIPEDVTDDTLVTREQLAYSLSKLAMPYEKSEPVNTNFIDVTAENKYSGYIRSISDLGVMTGNGDGYFRPKEPVSIAALSKTLITLLGYDKIAERKGGWPNGYVAVANTLTLYKNADAAEENVSYGNLKVILTNFLEIKVPEEVIYHNDGRYDSYITDLQSNMVYANKYLDLYKYEGIISDIQYESGEAKVTFTKQGKNSKYKEGDVKSFTVDGNVNIAAYENIPVSVVLYNDEVIVDVSLQKGIHIRYGVVDSVNHETEDVSYGTSYLKAITLKDDENDYTLSENCIFTYNCESFAGKIKLMDRYIKIAEKDEEILSLTTWDLTDGGLIAGTGGAYLNYTAGNNEKRLDGITDVLESTVIIDGEARGYKELKAGMAFSYYRDTDRKILVIAASERQMTDVLGGVNTSDNTLYLGESEVPYASDIYCSVDGKSYTSGAEKLTELCGTDVTLILDIYGTARYAVSYYGQTKSNKFTGYLMGFKDAEGLKDASVKIANVDEAAPAAKVYGLSKKIAYHDGLTADAVKASVGTTDGSALYEIEVSASGDVKSFGKLKEYEGFEGQIWSGGYGSFIDDGSPYLVVNRKKLYISRSTPTLCIDENSGETKFYRISYGSLVGKECNNKISLKFYGYEDNPELKMIVMLGDTSVVSGNSGMGRVESVGYTTDANGEEVRSVRVNGKTYCLADTSPVTPATGDFASYTVSLFENDTIVVDDAINLKDDLKNWDGKAYGKTVFMYGRIQKSDKLKVVLEGNVDGSHCYYYDGQAIKFYGVTKNGRLLTLSYMDLEPGMEVVIGIETATNGGQSITSVFVKKD